MFFFFFFDDKEENEAFSACGRKTRNVLFVERRTRTRRGRELETAPTGPIETPCLPPRGYPTYEEMAGFGRVESADRLDQRSSTDWRERE
jgi:hypothetical protein